MTNSTQPIALASLLLVLTASAACGDETLEDDPAGPVSLPPHMIGKCYSVSINDQTGGERPCGDVLCPAEEYCESPFFNECSPGCKNELDCAPGQYCLGGGSESPGVCAFPTASQEETCSSTPPSMASCADDCAVRLVTCGFDAEIDVASFCASLCTSLSAEQVACLRDAACSELASGGACGIDFGGGT